MAFHHRKLFDDSLEDSLEKLCKPYCYPVNNTDADGSCPVACITRCFPICNRPLLHELSPPPPPDYAFLSDNNNHPSKPFGLSVFLSISLAVLATIFFIFSCYTVYKFYKARYNSRSRQLSSQPPSQRQEEEAHLDFLDEDHGPVVDHPIWYIRTVGLQPSVISAITICKYKRGDGLVEGTECSVCLSEFQDDETLRLLPKCNHAFHIPCIDTWLGSHTNCPNCRAGIVVSTPNFQSPAQSLQSSGLNSGRLEEPQVGVSGIVSRESERERESEVLEVNIDVEDEEQSRVVSENQMENLVGSSGGSREGEGIQPMRRSVSMDSLSALAVSTAIANAFSIQSERNKDKNFTEMNGLNSGIASNGAGNVDQSGSSSMERSLQKETSIVKRSLSCSAKVFLSRYSKSRNSVLPP